MNRRVAIRGIAVKDGKLLCVRLKHYEGMASTSIKVEWWCLPGGGLDPGESLADGLEREFDEETAVKPQIGNLLYIQQFSTPETDTEHLEFFFHIVNSADYLKVDLSKATHASNEIEEIDFVDPKTTNVLPEFLQTEDLEGKISAGDSPKVFSFLA